MSAFANLTVLLVDPNASMRSSMHHMLSLCGIAKIDHAVSAGSSIRPIKARKFDLILCEYDLGDGQNGQQLLEDLRHNNLITLSTIFIIVTAERSYEKVVSTAELAPSDYILKPFTADKVLERITRAIERRSFFLPIYASMEENRLQDAVDGCLACEALNNRYLIDFMRFRAEIHIALGQPELAEPIYVYMLETRAVAWARLGLAKALFMQDKFDESEDLLSALVTENKNFLDAYDWLAKVHEVKGQIVEAKVVLETATTLSPNGLRRLRKLGIVASAAGDAVAAEQAFNQVVTHSRHSEFRDPQDHVKLVGALLGRGDAQAAAAVIRDMEKSAQSSTNKWLACSALSASMAHTLAGDNERAVMALEKAAQACTDASGLSADTKLMLIEQCLVHKMDSQATEVMVDVINNAPDKIALGKAHAVFAHAGRDDLMSTATKESQRRIVDLVAAGAAKAKTGDFRGAVDMMTQAAEGLPNNAQVVFNAAVAMLKCLEHMGWDEKLGGQAKRYIERAKKLDPQNPRMGPLTDMYQRISGKYGVLSARQPGKLK